MQSPQNKKYVMIFSITFIVCMMVVIVALVFLLPKQQLTLDASLSTYEGVSKSDYSYQATKDIEENSLVRDYTITSDQIQNFKRKNQYVLGNDDPFNEYKEEVTEDGENENTTTSGGNSSNTSSNPSTDKNTTNKITNSNGGTANPPSTNK